MLTGISLLLLYGPMNSFLGWLVTKYEDIAKEPVSLAT